jgi:hypothetical protein
MAQWKYEDINYSKINFGEVKSDKRIFLVLAASSFLEITAPLYTRNLIEYTKDSQDVVEWLEGVWLPEEVEHGRAMTAYVNAVWPEFNWESAYRCFYAEFELYCAADRYQPTKGLEMLARCVTEAGAATFYKALRDQATEPVLNDLLDQMQRDEVRHYKHFLRYFHQFNEQEENSRCGMLRTILSRALRVHDEDAFIAWKHCWREEKGGGTVSSSDYRRAVRGIRDLVCKYYPYEQAVKMLVQPLSFNKNLRKIPISILSRALRSFFAITLY